MKKTSIVYPIIIFITTENILKLDELCYCLI